MPNQLELLATAPGQLASSALSSQTLNDEDLQRLLQFLSEVNDVLAKSFRPLLKCLSAIEKLEWASIGGEEHIGLIAQLAEIQDRDYYNVRLVCNRLHGLRDHAKKHIEGIIGNLPNQGEWWNLFGRLDEREGFVEFAVREAVREIAKDLDSTQTESAFESLKEKACEIRSRVAVALNEIDSFAKIMHGGADRIGFLALTDVSRMRLADRITNIYDHRTQKTFIRRATFMGDIFSNISNSTIVSRSLVEGSFIKAKEKGGDEAANAIVKVAEEIDKSGNKDAGELFDAFNKELKAPSPKKAFLSSFWYGVTKALPTLLKLPDVALSIGKLIEMF